MFELYDIFDNNEINIILLSIFVLLLIIIISGLGYYHYNMKQKLIKVETELKNVSDTLDLNLNNNMFSDISNKSTDGSQKSNSDDQLEVETIIWRKKEYFLLEDDGKKKVFEITKDDDLGKEVGLWIDEKLVRPDKKKK